MASFRKTTFACKDSVVFRCEVEEWVIMRACVQGASFAVIGHTTIEQPSGLFAPA
jgi:hypothetical protein